MERKSNLFIATLKALYRSGALQNLILIGSWCHYFYKIYFKNSTEIPAVRTLDIDFLIPNPPMIRREVNIPEVLKSLDFIPEHNYTTGHTKYVHPELELEFLTPELGRGKGSEPYKISKLHINAQGLRYLNILQAHTIKIKYDDIKICIPEPAAFVLHKFIVFERRIKKEKMIRDLKAAKEIGEFLLKYKEQSEKLNKIFISLPKTWQKRIKNNLIDNSQALYNLLNK